MGTHDDEAESSRPKHSRQYETVEEVLLSQVHHEFLEWEGCNRDAKSRYNTKLAYLLLRHIYSPCVVNWDILNRMGCELCHEFYSTYEFDEVCANDELKTKKIIKFRLGGRAHRGLHSDEHFKAQEYWLSISQEENLSLSRSHASTIRNPLLARWMKRKGAGTQRESLICCEQFIMKLARKARVLSDDVLRSLSASIYCRDMDTTTLRELIDFEGKLILEAPEPGVPRVVVPRPQRALELARSSARSRL
ncbi:hypothetical protein Tco_0614804 [Tanacetum coccineum]